MVDGGLQAQGLQYPVAPNAQHNLLTDAHVRAPAVELVGDVPILGARVLRYVRVQQIEGHPAHLRSPHLGEHGTTRAGNVDRERRAVGNALARQRKIVEVVVLERLLLPPIGVEILAEVALLIEQSHCHQRHSEVAG